MMMAFLSFFCLLLTGTLTKNYRWPCSVGWFFASPSVRTPSTAPIIGLYCGRPFHTFARVCAQLRELPDRVALILRPEINFDGRV